MKNQTRRKTDLSPEFQEQLVQIQLESENEAQQRLIRIHQLMAEHMKTRMDYIRKNHQAKIDWKLSNQSDRRK